MSRMSSKLATVVNINRSQRGCEGTCRQRPVKRLDRSMSFRTCQAKATHVKQNPSVQTNPVLTPCAARVRHLQADGQGGVRTPHVLLRAPAAGWPAALALRCALHLAPRAHRQHTMHIAINACVLGCAHKWCRRRKWCNVGRQVPGNPWSWTWQAEGCVVTNATVDSVLALDRSAPSCLTPYPHHCP